MVSAAATGFLIQNHFSAKISKISNFLFKTLVRWTVQNQVTILIFNFFLSGCRIGRVSPNSFKIDFVVNPLSGSAAYFLWLALNSSFYPFLESKLPKKNPWHENSRFNFYFLGMTLTQVSTWFANARRRLKKENKWTPEQGFEDDSENKNGNFYIKYFIKNLYFYISYYHYNDQNIQEKFP